MGGKIRKSCKNYCGHIGKNLCCFGCKNRADCGIACCNPRYKTCDGTNYICKERFKAQISGGNKDE